MKIIQKILESQGYVKKEEVIDCIEGCCEHELHDLENLEKLKDLTDELPEIPMEQLGAAKGD